MDSACRLSASIRLGELLGSAGFESKKAAIAPLCFSKSAGREKRSGIAYAVRGSRFGLLVPCTPPCLWNRHDYIGIPPHGTMALPAWLSYVKSLIRLTFLVRRVRVWRFFVGFLKSPVDSGKGLGL